MADTQVLHDEMIGNELPDEQQLLDDALAGGQWDIASHMAFRIRNWRMTVTDYAKTAGVPLDDLLALLRRESCSTALWFTLERNTGPRLGYYMDSLDA